MFGIAGVLIWIICIPFGAAVLDEKNPPAVFGKTIEIPLYMNLIVTVMGLCWVLICVTYPFRKAEKKKKKE